MGDDLVGFFFSWAALATVLFITCAFSDNQPRQGYFYVKSTTTGYSVCINSWQGASTSITGDNLTLDQAKSLANSFNKDLQGYANK